LAETEKVRPRARPALRRGIFTGALLDADGTPIGHGSRRHTAPAAVSKGAREVTAVIGPVDVDLLGLTVTIEAFELALGEEMRPSSDWLEDPLHSSTARPGAASHHRLQAGEGRR